MNQLIPVLKNFSSYEADYTGLWKQSSFRSRFGVTTQTVYRRVKGIEALIGERYNQYAVLDNLVSVAVYADYEKYHTRLEDKNLKKYVPPFDMKAAGAYIFVDLNKGVSVL